MWSDDWDKEPLTNGGENPWHEDEEFLPRICLINVPHATIPGMFHCCFEYIEPWRFDPVAEVVETGRWVYGPGRDPGDEES